MWRAGCGGSRTSGSEGGQENPTSRKADRALLSDPYTYCRTWAGFVYVSFIIDVFSRKIVGWHVMTTRPTELVTVPLRMALWNIRHEGIEIFEGLLHQTDAGSQGGFNWSSQHFVIVEVCDCSSSTVSRSWDSTGVEVARCASASAGNAAVVLD